MAEPERIVWACSCKAGGVVVHQQQADAELGKQVSQHLRSHDYAEIHVIKYGHVEGEAQLDRPKVLWKEVAASG